MICMARIFGAPDTVPAGKVARKASNAVRQRDRALAHVLQVNYLVRKTRHQNSEKTCMATGYRNGDSDIDRAGPLKMPTRIVARARPEKYRLRRCIPLRARPFARNR